MTTTAPVSLRCGPLFWLAIDRIDADGEITDNRENPEPGVCFTRWDQSSWRRFIFGTNRCGTALCLAGYICELTGARWLVTTDEQGNPLLGGQPINDIDEYALQLVIAEDDDPEEDVDIYLGVRVVFASRRAVRLLGLERTDSDIDHPLFSGYHDYPSLQRLGESLFGPRPAAA